MKLNILETNKDKLVTKQKHSLLDYKWQYRYARAEDTDDISLSSEENIVSSSCDWHFQFRQHTLT